MLARGDVGLLRVVCKSIYRVERVAGAGGLHIINVDVFRLSVSVLVHLKIRNIKKIIENGVWGTAF